MDDEDIDFSDNPETDEDFWADAEVVLPKRKVTMTIRVDEDVLSWFRDQGRGYQTRMNAVLRSYMKSKKKVKHDIE
jgi:uncharacterized protein (DUF4415 family)